MSKMKNQKATLTTLNKNKQLKRVYGNRQKIEEMITKLNHLSLTGDNGSIRMKIMGIEGKQFARTQFFDVTLREYLVTFALNRLRRRNFLVSAYRYPSSRREQ